MATGKITYSIKGATKMNWDICNDGTITNVFKHHTSQDPVVLTDTRPISNDFAVLMNKQQGLEVVVKIDQVKPDTSYSGQVVSVRIGDQSLIQKDASFKLEHIDTLIKT